MDFNYIGEGIDAVVIDNFYTEDQLKEIMTELKWITKPSIMLREDNLAAATDDSGQIITSKSGVFVDGIFKDWRHSALISHGMTQTASLEFYNKLLSFNTMFKSIKECNMRSHLLSYYENSQYYKPHVDTFFFTILNYFFTEPKQFEGGELTVYSCNSGKSATIEPKHNRTVVMLSSTLHEAKEIKTNFKETLTGNGRYCNAIFLTVSDLRESNKNDSN